MFVAAPAGQVAKQFAAPAGLAKQFAADAQTDRADRAHFVRFAPFCSWVTQVPGCHVLVHNPKETINQADFQSLVDAAGSWQSSPS